MNKRNLNLFYIKIIPLLVTLICFTKTADAKTVTFSLEIKLTRDPSEIDVEIPDDTGDITYDEKVANDNISKPENASTFKNSDNTKLHLSKSEGSIKDQWVNDTALNSNKILTEEILNTDQDSTGSPSPT